MDVTIPVVLSIIGISFFGIVFLLIGLQTRTNTEVGVTGNTTLSVYEKSKLADDNWAFFFAALNAAGSMATAAALYFVRKQLLITQKQARLTEEEIKNTTPRPWVGTSGLSLENFGTPSELLKIHFENYGLIPAIITSLRILSSNDEIIRTRLLSGTIISTTELTNKQ